MALLTEQVVIGAIGVMLIVEWITVQSIEPHRQTVTQIQRGAPSQCSVFSPRSAVVH
jgi:hypothetical protein